MFAFFVIVVSVYTPRTAGERDRPPLIADYFVFEPRPAKGRHRVNFGLDYGSSPHRQIMTPSLPGGKLPKTRLYGRHETSFRFLKFAFNLLSAAHCQIPRLLGRDIDRKADQTAWIALGISQERKTEVNGRCNMRSHVPSQKPVLRLSSRTEFS